MIIKCSNKYVDLFFLGLLMIMKFENTISQSENSRKQYYLQNDDHKQQQEVGSKYIIHLIIPKIVSFIINITIIFKQHFQFTHQIPSEYLSFLQELSHFQNVKHQTLPQAVPQKKINHQQHVAKIQYEYEPKLDEQIRYVPGKEYAQFIKSQQEPKPLLKKPQQVNLQQNRLKQEQTRFNQNLKQREQLDQDEIQRPKQVTSILDESSFEKELKRLESLNRPINNQYGQQSGYNTRHHEVYQEDIKTHQPSTDNIKNKTQNENKRIHSHRELENSRLPFLDKDRVFSQSEFQAFLDAGYPGNI